MKRLNYVICLSAIVLFSGCIPYPHTTPRSPAVTGRVLDARTHAPIQGAEVQLAAPPTHAVYTDKDGYFHMKAHANMIWAVSSGGEWPDEKNGLMVISHTNYQSVANSWGGDIGDILLQPKK